MSSTARWRRPGRRGAAIAAVALVSTLLAGCGVGNSNVQSREFASGVDGYTGAINTIAVSNVVLFGPAVAGGSGQGYLYITNNGAEPDALTGITTPAAGAVQLYELNAAGEWQPQSSLPLISGPSPDPRDHAFRMELTDLATGLGVGRTYELTLTFRTAGSATLAIPVAPTPTGLSPLPAPTSSSAP